MGVHQHGKELVQGGGIIEKRSGLRLGQISEALAYYRLTCLGYDPQRVVEPMAFDLWVPYKGQILTVQVKSTSIIRSGGASYQFQLRKNNKSSYEKVDCDIFALVCIPLEKIIFRSDLHERTTIGIKPDEFHNINESVSWLEAAEEVLDRRNET